MSVPEKAFPSLEEAASLPLAALYARVGAAESGLSEAEARARLARFGPNEVRAKERESELRILLRCLRDPLSLLLVLIGLVSLLSGDKISAGLVGAMLLLGVALRYSQESRAGHAEEALAALVPSMATVLREGRAQDIPSRNIVPGDIVHLSAGDLVPADLRLVSSKDLFVNQAAMTGEAFPIEKDAASGHGLLSEGLIGLPWLAWAGTSVQSGSGLGIALETGARTRFGAIAAEVSGAREPSAFDRGVSSFARLMLTLAAVMVPLVFLFNGLDRGDWGGALLFAVAVAAGLTPEMLPMMVTVNLARGARDMARQRVIVKRLDAIQDLGAMDCLCTDKTGTLTLGRAVLQRYVGVDGQEDLKLLPFAYLNSFFQTGLRNLLDTAVLERGESIRGFVEEGGYRKLDEVPFDFGRKRMSVVVEDAGGRRTLVCKGAVEPVLQASATLLLAGEVRPLGEAERAAARQVSEALAIQGFRVLALATAEEEPGSAPRAYGAADEAGLLLRGFLAFYDPPKEGAAEAIEQLKRRQVEVKVLTGDAETSSAAICRLVGLEAGRFLLGAEIDELDDATLGERVGETPLFARLSPLHKERIIRALQAQGRIVGFLGDGINDAPALKAADVGISVEGAADVAKESSTIILLARDLLVLEKGVVEGRRVFGNIVKYIRMASSSNFGNMLSVLGASILLPFLPMLPVQILATNFLYDLSQTAIPSDEVDAEWLEKPRRWDIPGLRRFLLLLGPVSSIFDYLCFAGLILLFGAGKNPELFRAGWFVESVATQTLVIHVLRTERRPFIESRASVSLSWTTAAVSAFAAWLPFSPLARPLGFAPLPLGYWPFLALILAGYVLLAQLAKRLYLNPLRGRIGGRA